MGGSGRVQYIGDSEEAVKEVTIVLPVCLMDEELIASTYKCLKAVQDYTPRELFDIIVIENGSCEINTTGIEDHAVYIHVGRQPLGAARPFNMGVALARTRYVVFMSNDVYVTPGWLEGLLAAYKTYAWPGIVAPEEVPGREDWTPNTHWGACFITEREVWQKLGGWDEVNFPWRYCDQDLSIRAVQQGYNVGRTGLSVVTHKNMLTVNKMQDIIAPHAERERARMIELYGAAEFGEWMEKRNG